MYLERIVATKKQEVERLRNRLTISDAEKAISLLPGTLGFTEALLYKRHRKLGLIAEVKKASPSKGLIREDFSPVDLAFEYVNAGADCISVLTDETYFQGKIKDLEQIRTEVQIPLLRKDFIIDELQVYESRIMGADAVLLIAAILEDEKLKSCYELAVSLGLDILVEVHDADELNRVIHLLPDIKLVGVNNRNLKTFETSLKTTAELVSQIPKGTALISESGIRNQEDIAYLEKLGVSGVLIGETFMRHESPGRAVIELLDAADQGEV